MKKNVFLRSLYGFADSIVMIVFLFYFSEWLVIDQHVTELRYNISLIGASVLFILLAPILGKKVDQWASKIGWLRLWTALTALFFAIVGAMTLRAPQYVFLITVLFACAMAAYLMCFVYYTPMMNDLSFHKNNHGQVSGRGQGLHSFGQIAGLVAVLPIISGAVSFFGHSRASTFLPAVILFVIFALPMLIRYDAKEQQPEKPAVKSNIWKVIRELFSYKAVARFLIGYLFYSDALLTFSNNFPLYLEKVQMVPDAMKTALTAIILIFASVSAFFSGKLADRRGLKKTLMWLLAARCIIFPFFAFVHWLTWLLILSPLAGIIFWPVRSVSRALLSRLLPKHLAATGFSYYTVAERFSTLFGPLLRWGIVTGMGGSALGYRYALLSMALLIIVGWWATKKIKN